MKAIEKSKIKIGTKAKVRFRLANRRGQKGLFIFIDCTVIALHRLFNKKGYAVKLEQPIYDVVDKRTQEYEIANEEARVTNLYE